MALVALFLLLAGWVEYQTALLEWVLRGYWCGDRSVKKVALTFDDGPSDHTPLLLEVLKAHQVRATFFLIGENAERHPDLVGRIVEEGHAIGNHGYRDQPPPILGWDPCQTAHGIVRTQEVLEELTGSRPGLFRLPCARPRRDIWKIVRKERMLVVHTSCFSLWERKLPPRSLTRRILGRVKNGDIILLHDWSGSPRSPALEALPALLDSLKEREFQLVTISELLQSSLENPEDTAETSTSTDSEKGRH